jgi:hypothetical protein
MSNIAARTYDGAKAVTKSDSANDGPWAALWIGGAGSGNLKVTMVNGDVVAFAGVTASGNQPLTIAVLRVWSTGTDVTGIVGLKAMPFKPTTPAVPST